MTATWASVTALRKGARPNIKKLSPALTGTIRVFSLGGSISADYDDTGSAVASYRADLHEMVTDRGGLTLSWIGCRSGGPAGHPSRPTHALAGASCQSWLNSIPGGGVGAHALGSAPETLSSYPFEVALIECVINTANSNAETATWQADHVDLIGEMRGVHPSGRFVLLGPFDGGPDSPRRSNLATIRGIWDDMISDLIAAGHDNYFVPVDLDVIHRDVDMDPAEAKGDAVHWQPNGGLKVASAAFPAFMNACGYDAVW